MIQELANPVRLARMFRPARVAIIGATDTDGKTGTMVTQAVVRGEYKGHVVCVNPNRSTVFGRPCYPSLADSGVDSVDCAIVVVRAEHVVEAIRANSAQCKNFVVIAAGYGERGEDGRARQAELLHMAQSERLLIMGPNCLGFLSPHIGLNLSFAPSVMPRGDVALLSQSGALAVALLDTAAEQNTFGFSLVASLGNMMQLDEVAMLRYVTHDDHTKVAALYVEHISDGEALGEVIEQSPIPVVILQGGVTDAGHRASASHTGALAQRADIAAAVCRARGAVVTTSVETFIHTIAFVQRYGVTAAETVTVTNAGGLGVLTADALNRADVPSAELSSSLRAEVMSSLPVAGSAENPIDVLGDAGADRYAHVLRTLAKQSSPYQAITIATPQAQTPMEQIAETIVSHADTIPQIAVFSGGEHVRAARNMCVRNGVPVVSSPRDAVDVLAAIHATVRERPTGAPPPVDTVRAERLSAMMRRAQEERRPALYYKEVYDMAQAYDIPLVPAWRMDYDSPSHVRFPCVVKVDAPTILHKTDVRGVLPNIRDAEALSSAIAELQQRFPSERIIVQEMIPAGTEMFLGALRDPNLGVAVVIGYGGIYAEPLRTTVLMVPPYTVDDVRERLRNSRLAFLFRSFRGMPPHNEAAVAHIAVALQQLMREHPWVSSIDINPLFLYRSHGDARVVDMKITIQHT